MCARVEVLFSTASPLIITALGLGFQPLLCNFAPNKIRVRNFAANKIRVGNFVPNEIRVRNFALSEIRLQRLASDEVPV